jgi:hypothetical protein
MHHLENAHGDREEFREFLDPIFDPVFASAVAFAKDKRATNTTGHAVVPASQREIDQSSASD